MAWTVRYLNETVAAEVDALPLDMRAKFLRIVTMIESMGLERVHEPYVKHLEGRLWEMRMTGRDGISRAIYLTAAGPARGCAACIPEEDPKNPARRIGNCAPSRQGG